jgi:hypothetical protein
MMLGLGGDGAAICLNCICVDLLANMHCFNFVSMSHLVLQPARDISWRVYLDHVSGSEALNRFNPYISYIHFASPSASP